MNHNANDILRKAGEAMQAVQMFVFMSAAILSMAIFSNMRGGAALGGPLIAWREIGASFINGAVCTLLGVIHIPALTLVGMPLLLTLEYLFMAKGKHPQQYLYLFAGGTVYVSTSYVVLATIFSLLPTKIWRGNGALFHSVILILTFITGFCATVVQRRFHWFLNDSIILLFGHKRRAILLFTYLLLTDFLLLMSAQFMVPAMFAGNLPYAGKSMLAVDSIIKTLLAAVGCFFVANNLGESQRAFLANKLLSAHLSKEKAFRENIYKGALMGYCANITKNVLEEGGNFFSEKYLGGSDNYELLMSAFIERCVHPEDKLMMLSFRNAGYYDKMLSSSPSYSRRFRVSPERFVENTNLPDHAREQLLAAHKTWIWAAIHVTLVMDMDNGDLRLYGTLTDVDNIVMQEAQLRKEATRDSLTGLYNRSAAIQLINEFLHETETGGAFYMVDMDNFKVVNDTLGHPEGDKLLCQVSAMFGRVFRRDDIIARIGGDEFCVFAPGLAIRPLIEGRAAELVKMGCREFQGADGKSVPVSLSVGVAVCPDNGTTFEELYEKADIALYYVKAEGRNNYHVYSTDGPTAKQS